MGSRGRVYNNFYTDELWEQVNNENKMILNDFIAEYKQRKKAKSTISGYTYDLKIILIYILKKHGNKSVLEMNKKDFRGMSIYFSDECGLSSSRVNRLKSSINSMMTFCEEDDDYDYDVNYSKKVAGIPRQRVRDNEDNFFFTFDEFIKVRDILVGKGKLQDAVLWSLGFDSAGRKNELYQVNKQGLLDGNKTNIVIGKRSKKFCLVYLNDTKELIRQYLEERGEDDIDSLWYKHSDGKKVPVTNEFIYSRICSISKILSEVRGEECYIFPHSLRHSRLECLSQGTDTRLVDSEGNLIKYPLEKIQVFAHHASCDVTQTYLKNHDDDTINEMFGFSE